MLAAAAPEMIVFLPSRNRAARDTCLPGQSRVSV